MNRNLRLLRTLYTSASAKYYKLKRRYEKRIQNNTFHQLTKRKQYALVNQLKKLYERLKSLHALLRVAAVGSVITLASSISTQAQGVGPFNRNDDKNPLPPPHEVIHPRLALADLDGDGDLDAFAGNALGNIQFFRNDGSDTPRKRFTEINGVENPLNGINKGPQAAPAFVDIDGDGDLDLFLGVNAAYFNPPGGPNEYEYSRTFFFRNTGTATNPVFTEETGASNPFNGIYAPKYGPGIPVFADMDGDNDLDLFLGGVYSNDAYGPNPGVVYYENQGSVTSPNFVQSSHPLVTALQYLNSVAIALADMDGDGDLDAFVGQYFSGNGILVFRNDGATSFTELTDNNLPTRSLYARTGSPAFGDLDGDDDLDLAVGNTSSNTPDILYLENTGNFNLVEMSGLNQGPFGGVDVGNEASPTFIDLDNDGDLDVVIGAKYSDNGLSVFTNEGGIFIKVNDHPVVDAGDFSKINPVFADIDDDGDSDLFLGGRGIRFFRNDGSGFESETTLFPTLTSYNSRNTTLALVDIDDDGDLDAFIGNARYSYANVLFFRNTGSATSPVFTQQATPAPFNDTELFEYLAHFSPVDIDNDGDLDLVVTETYSAVKYAFSRIRVFENDFGEFIEIDGEIMGNMPPGGLASYGDVDGDGDLDIVVGNAYDDFNGKIIYLENVNPAPVTSVSLNTVSVSLNTPAVLDPDLTITDDDDDNIVQATVTISNYTEGNEELDFTANSGITGEFEDGVLTIRGLAPREEYEEMLRTVTYEFSGNVTSGRTSARAGVPPQGKTVTFSVRDVDFTETVVSQVNVITLNIIGEPEARITVYNAVSPGVSSGLNDYMRITGLPAQNKVSIFNRWGDKVFEVSGYDNVDKRFEGKTDSGKDLPTGTYYYLIELKDQKIDGFLSLRR